MLQSLNRTINSQPADPAVRKDSESHMRSDPDIHQFIEKMPSVCLQFRARQHRFPDKCRILQTFNRLAGGVTSLKRTALRKISLEPGGIDFEPANIAGPSQLNDGPIVTGPAPALGFPAIAHIYRSPRHDQIVTV